MLNSAVLEPLREGAEAAVEAALAAARAGDQPKQVPQTPPLSVVDRFETLLSVGPAIVAAGSPESVFEALSHAACQLLRGQRCAVYRVNPPGTAQPFELVAGDREATAASHRLMKEAISAGQPVIAGDDTAHEPSESLLLADVRSALAAPVIVRGYAVACVYVTHTQVGRLYREEDRKVAEFIAALAGAALESAEAVAQMQVLNASLGTQVKERQRAAEELAVAHAAAEAASRAKSDFLANVSHEIRTPLGSILGYADLMESDAVSDADRRQFLTVIRRNGDQLLTLVNDILDLSKVEAGKLIVEAVPTHLEAEIVAVATALEPQARQKGLTLGLKLAPNIPVVIVADPVRLRQVLMNIIGNAVKFTQKGRVDVDVARRSHPTRGGKTGIAIAVNDTGIGLSPEQAAKLFRPFNQADESTSRRFGGSGLGLALSRRLAHLLGGDLLLECSAPEAGSTFTLWLDVPEGYSETLAPAPTARRQTDAAVKPLPGVQVLLVEDMPDIQRLSAMVLRNAGASVEIAGTGGRGLELARGGGFDLILLDIQLPELDGIEVLRTLRAENNETPIVMLTAHGMLHERDLCFDIGCNDYVVKPVKPADLPTVVRRNLRLTRMPTAVSLQPVEVTNH